MGQRSQIYIRIIDKNNNVNLIAKYFQWNYGERMISRARYGIEYIKRNIEYLGLDSVRERIDKIFDVNFDMQDVAISSDIIQETRDYFGSSKRLMNEYIFLNQDNNDGKLFVECNENNGEIKYCFTDYEMNILSADEYMKWDMGAEWKAPNFYSGEFAYLNDDWLELIPICVDNINYINENAKMMTPKELEHFIKDDYSIQIGESTFVKTLRDFLEKKMEYCEFSWYKITKIDDKGSWKFSEKYSKDICMQYDATRNKLIVNPSFNKEYNVGFVQDIKEYYSKDENEMLLDIGKSVEDFEHKINEISESNEEKIESEINYDYE